MSVFTLVGEIQRFRNDLYPSSSSHCIISIISIKTFFVFGFCNLCPHTVNSAVWYSGCRKVVLLTPPTPNPLPRPSSPHPCLPSSLLKIECYQRFLLLTPLPTHPTPNSHLPLSVFFFFLLPRNSVWTKFE